MKLRIKATPIVTPKRKRRRASAPSDASSLALALPAADGSVLTPPVSSRTVVPASSHLLDSAPLINFRPYQRDAFLNRENGIELWLWGRQTGKSFTLAAWCVDRLITIPGRTVTVLSNSKFNGLELNRKCAEICALYTLAFEQADLSTDHRFESLRAETRITINGQVGRILILAPNPRTVRGFSGDLIFDEFAHMENNALLWEEAKPTLERNPDFLCRISSTPNGKHDQFYRMVTDPLYCVRKVTRTDAYHAGQQIFHPMTRQPITPEEARALAQNKRAYDQNYECTFEDESMALLTYDLISQAERTNVGVICDQAWSAEAMAILLAPLESILRTSAAEPGSLAAQRKTAEQWVNEATDQPAMLRHILMHVCHGGADRLENLFESHDAISIHEVYSPYNARNGLRPRQRGGAKDSGRTLCVGIDVGRHHDRTVVTVLERTGNFYSVRAILRLADMPTPVQEEHIAQVLRLPDVRCAVIDKTGLGFGLYERLEQRFPRKVYGLHFACSIEASKMATFPAAIASSPPTHAKVRITEYLATHLLHLFQSGAIQHPIDATLRDDLRKPERFVSPNGRVSIAATRTATGHADHFWSLALAIYGAQELQQKPLQWWALPPRERMARL